MLHTGSINLKTSDMDFKNSPFQKSIFSASYLPQLYGADSRIPLEDHVAYTRCGYLLLANTPIEPPTPTTWSVILL